MWRHSLCPHAPHPRLFMKNKKIPIPETRNRDKIYFWAHRAAGGEPPKERRSLPPAGPLGGPGSQRYQVKPLALSRFLRRGTEPACKNRSAAPGCRCPNMQRGTQPACIFGRRSSCGALNMRRIRDDACIFRPRRQRRLPASSTGRGRRRCLWLLFFQKSNYSFAFCRRMSSPRKR